MIVFFNKKTGSIVGTIDGRVNGKEDLAMWIGSREDNNRLVFTWKKNIKGWFEPDVEDKNLKDILYKLDKKSISIYDFIIDIKKNTLIRKN